MLCQKYFFSFFLEPTKGKFGEEIRQRLSENVTEMVRIVLTKTIFFEYGIHINSNHGNQI